MTSTALWGIGREHPIYGTFVGRYAVAIVAHIRYHCSFQRVGQRRVHAKVKLPNTLQYDRDRRELWEQTFEA